LNSNSQTGDKRGLSPVFYLNNMIPCLKGLVLVFLLLSAGACRRGPVPPVSDHAARPKVEAAATPDASRD
jgi:hypothetical protein